MGLTILVVGENSKAKSMANRLTQAKNGFSDIEICRPADLMKRMHAVPRPEVVLLEDCSLPRNTSLQGLITCMAKLAKETRVLVLGAGELRRIIAAVKAGAQGYISNCTDGEELIELIYKDSKGKEFILSRCLASFPPRAASATPSSQAMSLLTGREREIMPYIVQGMTSQEMSEILCISDETAKWHVKNILSKLGVRKKIQLIGMTWNGAPEIPLQAIHSTC
jgi:DNA-binding NarL/FixJ family response regulator